MKGGVVNANTMVDKHSPSSALLRVCENGLYMFAKTLIEHGAQVKHMASADRGKVAHCSDMGVYQIYCCLYR